jgi:hypothetical protein
MLKTVTFVDAVGRRLLEEMHRQGAKLTAEECMTRAIVDEIASTSVLNGVGIDRRAQDGGLLGLWKTLARKHSMK